MSKRPRDEPNLCPLCLLDVNGSLQAHFDKEHSEFDCPLCVKSFKSQQDLDFHVKIVHDEIKNVLSCPVCDADFDQADILQNHIDSHFQASQIFSQS